ncbi:MAG: hypothetical protein HMLKMBBP_01849 [Planctomycetes bacterium]|nr:hypothetical protein [Planctomycetota bacterium]
MRSLVASVLFLAGCASSTPAADRVVYESAPVAVHGWGGTVPAAPARDDVPESVRRAWLDSVQPKAMPVAAHDPAAVPSERVVVRERVRYVGGADCRTYVPPVHLSLDWYDHGRRHSHFGWGLGWSWPLWGGCR